MTTTTLARVCVPPLLFGHLYPELVHTHGAANQNFQICKLPDTGYRFSFGAITSNPFPTLRYIYWSLPGQAITTQWRYKRQSMADRELYGVDTDILYRLGEVGVPLMYLRVAIRRDGHRPVLVRGVYELDGTPTRFQGTVRHLIQKRLQALDWPN